MPITYEISDDKRTIRAQRPKMIDDLLQRQMPGRLGSERADVFLDLSEVDSIPETPQISTVVTELSRLRTKLRFDACALLAGREALFGMMRVFEVMAEGFFRVTRTFRVAAEAEAWLVSQQSLAEHKPEDGR